MRSLEKRQYEIEQGLRDPSELLGGKDKDNEGDDGDEEESEAAKAAKAENLTKAAITAANKLLKSTDEVERMKVSGEPCLSPAVCACLPHVVAPFVCCSKNVVVVVVVFVGRSDS